MDEWPDYLVPYPVSVCKYPFGLRCRNNSAPDLLRWATKTNRCWCLERARIRWHPSDHNCDAKNDSEASETEGACGQGVDGLHVSAESTGEEEESGLEDHWKTLDEKVHGHFSSPSHLR